MTTKTIKYRKGTIPKLAVLLFLIISIPFAHAKASDFTGIENMVARRIPWLRPHVIFKDMKNAENLEDAFTLQTKNNNLIVSASSPAAAGMAVNWYLKYYCHQSLSLQSSNILPLEKLPQIPEEVNRKTPFKFRYSLNYCTISYTMAFYKWEQWSYFLDWLALNGVNLALAPVGNEKVWDLTLQDFNFNKPERQAFIAGPAFSAWWLMGNLVGWGGPESEAMMDQQTALQKKILGRMKTLGIQPVLQGFYGMVPTALSKKYPAATILDQGKWAGGFTRPAVLSPEDPLFAKMAASYYHHVQQLYGKGFRFFGGDLFHEGGISKGVDLAMAGKKVHEMMEKYFPGSSWVLQGWGNNPNPILISKIPADKLLILDLKGENSENYLTNNGFNGHSWIFASVNNFGENLGLYGRLEYLAQQPFKVLQMAAGKSLVGIGEMPEGYHNNPVLYDLIFDVAWQSQPFNINTWINQYADYRYGNADENVKSAWQTFLHTVYTSDINPQQGAPESVFCARPSLKAAHARTWGTLKRSYDTHAFEKAVKLFAGSASKYRTVATYQYDLIDFTRQVISNRGLTDYKLMVEAYEANNKEDFQKYTDRFLQLLKMQDGLLENDKNFRLDTWLKSAYDFGQTHADKKLAVWNARTQISYWGPDNSHTDLHDYANKEWGGMLGTLYLQRWEAFTKYLQEKLNGMDPKEPDYFEMEKDWANEPYKKADFHREDAVSKAVELLKVLDD